MGYKAKKEKKVEFTNSKIPIMFENQPILYHIAAHADENVSHVDYFNTNSTICCGFRINNYHGNRYLFGRLKTFLPGQKGCFPFFFC